ncbi:MAG: T9SS type A sorting domain-containing protein [Candidatus Margulisiibacteriota bacterium]
MKNSVAILFVLLLFGSAFADYAASPISFKVQGRDLKVSGAVLCYKNPFNPSVGESTNITYTLSNNADISIYIYNIIGQLIKKINRSSGTAGGSAGYNEVPWTGRSDFNEIVGNDVYFVKVVSGGNVLGKCKLAVLK